MAEHAEAYARFLVSLHTARVIVFCGRGWATIGLFFVTKNGKLRFIADAHRANAMFCRPPRAVLGSMESWARISVAWRDGSSVIGSALFFAQEDVRDACSDL